jgi:hypothetical protein
MQSERRGNESTPQCKQTKKNCFMNISLLKRGSRITASKLLKKNFELSTLSFSSFAGNKLLGPYFLSPRLTGAVCHDFLLHVLPELLQDLDLQTSIHMWFMHDGAPPHFILSVRKFWNKNISSAMDRTRCTNSMACWFRYLNSLHFYPCPQGDSNARFQRPNSCRSTPNTAQPPR